MSPTDADTPRPVGEAPVGGPDPVPSEPGPPHPFDEGRDRGLAWAREALERAQEDADVDIETVLGVRAVQNALGTDRGLPAWGFLFGVREVVESLPPYQRPNLIFEVSDPRGTHQLPGQVRRGFWASFRAAMRGEF